MIGSAFDRIPARAGWITHWTMRNPSFNYGSQSAWAAGHRTRVAGRVMEVSWA